MAAEYLFLDTANNVNVTVVTDSARRNVTFFVTELRNYDTQDIIQGIDVDVQEYHERDFIDMAMESSVALYRTDNRGESCLVIPGVVAGRFNGLTSNLVYSSVAVSTSGSLNDPLIFKQTVRLSQEDFEASLSNPRASAILFTGISTDRNTVFEAVLSYQEPEGEDEEPSMALIIMGQLNSDRTSALMIESNLITNIIDRCLEIEVSFSLVSNTFFRIVATVNGVEFADQQISPSGLTSVAATVALTYGFPAFPGQNFQGIMRNIEVTGAGTAVINTPDPSTGVNSAGANGVATDITSVTVIV